MPSSPHRRSWGSVWLRETSEDSTMVKTIPPTKKHEHTLKGRKTEDRNTLKRVLATLWLENVYEPGLIFLMFMFQLQFTFSVTLYCFHVHSTAVRHLYNLWVIPRKSSTHLAPHIITILIPTIPPMLYFTSPWLFCNYRFVILNLFTSFSLNVPALVWFKFF